jgi:hypothetical protein
MLTLSVWKNSGANKGVDKMALTEKERQELADLEATYGQPESVLSPRYQPPGLLQQFGQATLQTLPEIGGLVGGVVGAATTRSPIGAQSGAAAGRTALASLGRGLLGTGFGTVYGTAIKQQVDTVLGRPQPLEKNLAEQLSNAATNVALDAAGNLVFQLAGKAFKVAKEAIPPTGLFGGGVAEKDLKLQVQKLLEREGGGLTRYQVSGSPLASVTESIGRAGISGRPTFTQLEQANLKALQTSRDQVLDEVSTRFVDDLNSGAAYKDIITRGQEALSQTVKPFYEQLPKRGGNIPVVTQGISQSASQQLARAEAISKTGDPSLSLGSEVVSDLRKLSDLKDNISFAEAHEFRSKLGERLRAVRDEFGKNSPQVALLSRTMKDIDVAMDAAASRLDPALKAEYDSTSKFYRQGITELFPKTLAKLDRTTAERLGETVFRSGNVSEVVDFYKSLDRAKQLDPKLDVAAVRSGIQRGYLASQIGEEGTDFSANSLLTLGKKLQEDKKFRRTFDTALDPEVRKNVDLLINAVKLSQQKPQNTFSLAINSEQAEGVRGVLQGLVAASGALGAYSELGLVGGVAAGTGILLTPRVMAKFATNREAVNSLLDAERSFRNLSNLPADQKQQAVLRTIALMNSAYDRAGVTAADLAPQQQPETAPAQAPTGGTLTPEEQEELKKLMSRYEQE